MSIFSFNLENLLFGNHGELKLTDFGCSVAEPRNRRNTSIGTTDYMPPEMVARKPYSNSVDNWSLGILIYEMICGFPPFEEKTEAETNRRITSLTYSFPAHVSANARNIISRLLQLDGTQRLSLLDAVNHPWIISNLPNPLPPHLRQSYSATFASISSVESSLPAAIEQTTGVERSPEHTPSPEMKS